MTVKEIEPVTVPSKDQVTGSVVFRGRARLYRVDLCKPLISSNFAYCMEFLIEGLTRLSVACGVAGAAPSPDAAPRGLRRL